MRLFVALSVPEGLARKAAALASELPQEAITPVKPESMHLTIRFIGEADEAAKLEIIRRLKEIRFAPIRCALRGVGVFPDESYVRVAWAGVESQGALESLAKDIIDALAGYGKEEGKGFTAHLTIARVRRKIDPKQFLSRHKDEEFGDFDIRSFELKESIMSPGSSPVYKTVAVFPFSRI
jgi:2'-5' RNA ligase